MIQVIRENSIVEQPFITSSSTFLEKCKDKHMEAINSHGSRRSICK